VLSEFASYVGGVAAVLASLSYIPQVRKAWPRGSTGDLSLGMLAALTLGLSLWIAYGLLRQDWVVVCANAIGTGLAAVVLGCKIRDL
jgi:MtN3 and saliva related transmembrane protein